MDASEANITKLEERIEASLKAGEMDLSAKYQPKLDKLAARVEGSKISSPVKARLMVRIETFARALKTKVTAAGKPLTADAAEDRFQKLSDAVGEALENIKG